jgi:hypothetical protein
MNKTTLTKWTSRDARTCPDPGTPEWLSPIAVVWLVS